MVNVVVHYSEIGLKGGNRNFFEDKLVENLRKVLGKKVIRVYKRYGRFICELKTDNGVKEILEKIPGVANFGFAVKCKLDMNDIREKVLGLLKGKKFESFRITSTRSFKGFKKTSREINEIIGGCVIDKFDKKVKLKNPDIEIFIEIGEKEVFVFLEKIQGIGGLGVGSSGKLICSLSGGIDSPVAGFMMMKRGCKVVFVHIHNENLVKESVLEKLKNIVNELTKVQLDSKFYVVPFEKIQKQIIMNVPAKFRMIVYRRVMMKIINDIAKKEKAKGIVTGDSIGQVASQTIDNLNCIYDACLIPVFSPLIGLNKEEIIKTAEKIGTFKHSVVAYPDCCSFMIAKHPETKGKLSDIIKLEKNIKNQEKLIKDCVSGAKVLKFN